MSARARRPAVIRQDTLFAEGACQRWFERRHSWQYPNVPMFEPRRYAVVPLDEAAARDFTIMHHYTRAWPSTTTRFGLVEDGETLVGTCVLGVPMHPAVLTAPFPTLVPYRESLELVRLVLLDHVPANAESWFVSRVFRAAAEMGVRGVIAFSDPVPRHVGGVQVMPGHVGTVYQALGAVYTGRGTSRTLTVLPNGTVLTARTIAKITGGEPGAAGAVARLVAMGAPPKGCRQTGREWLPEAFDAIGARKVRHPGNHRYAWAIGNRADRRWLPVALPSLPYPKRAGDMAGAVLGAAL